MNLDEAKALEPMTESELGQFRHELAIAEGHKHMYVSVRRDPMARLLALAAAHPVLVEVVDAKQQQHGDGPCYYCGKRTQSSAGNPALWATFLSHEEEPGLAQPHHVGCVIDRLERTEAAESKAAALEGQVKTLREASLNCGSALTYALSQHDNLAQPDSKFKRTKLCEAIKRAIRNLNDAALAAVPVLMEDANRASEYNAMMLSCAAWKSKAEAIESKTAVLEGQVAALREADERAMAYILALGTMTANE